METTSAESTGLSFPNSAMMAGTPGAIIAEILVQQSSSYRHVGQDVHEASGIKKASRLSNAAYVLVRHAGQL